MPTQNKGKPNRVALDELLAILKDLVFLMEDIRQLLKEIKEKGNKKH